MLENIIIITIVVHWCWFLYVLLQQKRINERISKDIVNIEHDLMNLDTLNLASEQQRQWKFNTRARKEMLALKKIIQTFVVIKAKKTSKK